MYTYIKYELKGYYFEIPSLLDNENFNVGETLEDFINGKFVLLNDEQLNFKTEHPEATVEEVFNMKLNEVIRTIEQAKNEKIYALQNKAQQAIQDVSYEGKDIYVDAQRRIIVKDEAEVAKANNVSVMSLDNGIEIAPNNAISLMSVMTEREKNVNNIKEAKIAEINSLDDIDEVDNIDVDTIFPSKTETTVETLNEKEEQENANLPEKQAVSLLKLTINTLELDDNQALSVKLLYSKWEDFIGKELKQGNRVLYDGKLYNVRQDVPTVLENQYPSIDTAALYEEVAYQHAGTMEDPIPYNNNMELFNGKYYTQDGVLYLCNRDTEQAVYNPLADLVGLYVQKVSE